MSYCFSTNGNYYVGEYKTRDDALVAGRAEYGVAERACTQMVWTAKCVPAERSVTGPTMRPRIDDLLEDLNEQLHDDIGCEDDIVELSCRMRDALAIIVGRFLREKATFTAFGVADVEEHRFSAVPWPHV